MLLVIITVYFLPVIIAFSRNHTYRWPILLLNVFGAASGVPWVIALIWSVWPGVSND